MRVPVRRDLRRQRRQSDERRPPHDDSLSWRDIAGNLHLARHLVPAIGGLQVQRTWAGVNTLVDLVSVLGPVESLPGLYFAVPGDAGFTLGPYCARLVADAILGHSPDFPLDRFSIARFRKS